MNSKAEIIKTHLKDKVVLDIGAAGYGETNAYEQELAQAWNVCHKRITVDYSETANISVNLNSMPLPAMDDHYDVATAFDVLEHLEHPVEVLRWIPSNLLIVTLPNALSWMARHMEEKNKSKHLYSFTPYTASILLGEGGWGVAKIEFLFGKWSLRARTINTVGSLWPSRVGTGIAVFCNRNLPKTGWNLR